MHNIDNEHFDIENMALSNGEDPHELRDFIQDLIDQGAIRGTITTRNGREVFMLADGETFQSHMTQLLTLLSKSRKHDG